MDIYSEIILDHYKNPHNKGKIPHALTATEHNVSCGDIIHFYLLFDKNGKVKKASFEGSGCAISQAAASMLTDHLLGKTATQIQKMDKSEILSLLNIPIGPARLKCALIALSTAKKALSEKALSKPRK